MVFVFHLNNGILTGYSLQTLTKFANHKTMQSDQVCGADVQDLFDKQRTPTQLRRTSVSSQADPMACQYFQCDLIVDP